MTSGRSGITSPWNPKSSTTVAKSPAIENGCTRALYASTPAAPSRATRLRRVRWPASSGRHRPGGRGARQAGPPPDLSDVVNPRCLTLDGLFRILWLSTAWAIASRLTAGVSISWPEGLSAPTCRVWRRLGGDKAFRSPPPAPIQFASLVLSYVSCTEHKPTTPARTEGQAKTQGVGSRPHGSDTGVPSGHDSHQHHRVSEQARGKTLGCR